MIKLILINVIFTTIIYAQTTIKIYNQGHALVQEERKKKLNNLGRNNLLIPNLPKMVKSSSINLYSNDINIISKEYIIRPISIENLLNANIGGKIELVKYAENGKIIFSTEAKLVSNNIVPIFEIDGKFVVNPPYSYRFNAIPESITDYPYLNCVIENSSKNINYNLSYITSGLNWSAEYNLHIVSDELSEIEGWYFINNDTKINFLDASISLVSGFVNFKSSDNMNYKKSMRPLATKLSASANLPEINPTTNKIDEYVVFDLEGENSLYAKSQIRYKFLYNDKVSYIKTYHIPHSFNRYHRNTSQYRENIPVLVRYQILAKEIGEFQIPSGTFNVYRKEQDALSYIGSGESKISDGNDIIKLETGTTNDIQCSFIIQDYKMGRESGRAELNAVFENRKKEPVVVEWIEYFSDGRWEIKSSSIKFEKLDANRAKFLVNIPSKSKAEVSLSIYIDK